MRFVVLPLGLVEDLQRAVLGAILVFGVGI
jgi:hypothetical protein